jgi:hypothetical protein
LDVLSASASAMLDDVDKDQALDLQCVSELLYPMQPLPVHFRFLIFVLFVDRLTESVELGRKPVILM